MRWRKRLEDDREKLLVEGKKASRQEKGYLPINQYIEALDMLRADDTGDPGSQEAHRTDQGAHTSARWERYPSIGTNPSVKSRRRRITSKQFLGAGRCNSKGFVLTQVMNSEARIYLFARIIH